MSFHSRVFREMNVSWTRIVPVFVAAYSICLMFRTTVIVYKAFLLDPYGLGIPVFSTTSLSYALHIPSVPSVYFRTRAVVFRFCGI